MGQKYFLSRRINLGEDSPKDYLALTDLEGNLIASSRDCLKQPLLFDAKDLPNKFRSLLEDGLDGDLSPFEFGRVLRKEEKVKINSSRDVFIYSEIPRQVEGVYENFLTRTALLYFLKGYFPEGDFVTKFLENSPRKIMGVVKKHYEDRERA